MYPAAFEYHAPASVAEALKLLGKLDDAKILAGGHSLIPMMKLRLANPPSLIDIGGIEELRGIKQSNGGVTIGALTTHTMVEESQGGDVGAHEIRNAAVRRKRKTCHALGAKPVPDPLPRRALVGDLPRHERNWSSAS